MTIEFKGISKLYGSVTAVADLNLVIEKGALHFLLGPSGCGKTTTLRMLAGLETPSAGRILFDGRDVTRLPAAERGVGMVFQNYALWPHMTVGENVEYGLKIKKLSAARIADEVAMALDITQLSHLRERLPGQLSGGQQQRVALARALAIHPSVLLLDEPLSNLDAKLRLEMRDNISRIHRKTAITTVYVTHDQKEALSMGTAISVMRDGHLVQSGAPRDLYDEPESAFIASFVGETNLVSATIAGSNGAGYVVDCDLGKVTAGPTKKSFRVGEKVTLSIRPEAVRLAAETVVADTNRFDMVLDHLTYLGESEQLALKHHTGKGASAGLLRSSLFHSSARHLNEGEIIALSVAPADIHVLPLDARGID